MICGSRRKDGKMDKGIILVNMPDKCCNCRMGFENEYYDQFECYFKPGTEIKPDEGKPDWCPIRPIPEKKEITGITFSSGYAEWNLNGQDRGWNACIDELLKDGG